MAPKLRRVGIARASGFMLNATHYDWTRANIKYGVELSRRVGGKHFIINTAENGRGPIHKRLPNGRRLTVWCNPPPAGWARRRPPKRRIRWSTPTCGSTDRATRSRARAGRSPGTCRAR